MIASINERGWIAGMQRLGSRGWNSTLHEDWKPDFGISSEALTSSNRRYEQVAFISVPA